jgi:hypothetical protein
MNIKSLRKIIWNARRPARPVYCQLELNLSAPRLGREDLEVIDGLRRLRAELGRK